jgi:hypothetical protein
MSGQGNEYYRIRQEIADAIGNLQDVLPALTKEDRVKLYNLIGPIDPENNVPKELIQEVNIDDVVEQYRLVQHIRKSILDPSNTIKHDASARELSALTSAISNLCNMFYRHQDKTKLMSEVQSIKRAVSIALESCDPEVKQRFITVLQRVRDGDTPEKVLSTPSTEKQETSSDTLQ